MLLFASDLSIAYLAGFLLGALIGMTVHEFAHNYVAHLMGDPVPAREGRLTLDPTVHIYWPGFLMFVLIGFGILGSAPISANRMRNPRWGYLAAVAAGPFSNLLLAVIFGVIVQLIGLQRLVFNYVQVWEVLQAIIVINIVLFLFNLLPLFPLDGWHMLLALLPPDQAYWWQRNAQTTQYVFMFILLLSFFPLGGFDPFGIIIREPLNFILRTVLGL
ncbi:MAG: site-2 protease family protein [Anaerolineae bacterium]